MTAFLTTQCRWLVTERLPPHGHDLSPVEQVWGNLKNRELANLGPDTAEEAAVFANDGPMRIGEDTRLRFSFLKHCDLHVPARLTQLLRSFTATFATSAG